MAARAGDSTRRQPASMKALPKRKGNGVRRVATVPVYLCLNESPSQKEGKFRAGVGFSRRI